MSVFQRSGTLPVRFFIKKNEQKEYLFFILFLFYPVKHFFHLFFMLTEKLYRKESLPSRANPTFIYPLFFFVNYFFSENIIKIKK